MLLGRDMMVRLDPTTHSNLKILAAGWGMSPSEMAAKIVTETVHRETVNGIIIWACVRILTGLGVCL